MSNIVDVLFEGRYNIFQSGKYSWASRKKIPFIQGNQDPDCVTIFAPMADGLIPLVHQWRGTIGEWILELPAGKIDTGETICEAAIREHKEETGLTLRVNEFRRNLFPTVGITDECHALVIGRSEGKISTEFLHGDEKDNVKAMLLTIPEIEDILKYSFSPVDMKLAMIIAGITMTGIRN